MERRTRKTKKRQNKWKEGEKKKNIWKSQKRCGVERKEIEGERIKKEKCKRTRVPSSGGKIGR